MLVLCNLLTQCTTKFLLVNLMLCYITFKLFMLSPENSGQKLVFVFEEINLKNKYFLEMKYFLCG